VGIITGTCFAERGNNVNCVDIGTGKLKALGNNRSPLREPGLVDLIIKNFKEGRLTFTSDIVQAVKDSFMVFIAVEVKVNGDGNTDKTAILSVSQSIGRSLNDYKIIVTKCTVPVGTTEMIRDKIREYTDVEFDVASNPDFLNEGSAVDDFMKPDRVVIGTDQPGVAGILKELYSPFMRSSEGYIFVSIRAAELTKYAEIRNLQTGLHSELNIKAL